MQALWMIYYRIESRNRITDPSDSSDEMIYYRIESSTNTKSIPRIRKATMIYYRIESRGAFDQTVPRDKKG